MNIERMEGTEVATNQLLKNKYDLHKSREVEFAAQRTLARNGERVPQDPLLRIQNFLNRFHEITDREDPAKREQGIDAFKRLIHSKYVIKPEEIPESFWENQRRIIRERGQEADLDRADWEMLKRQVTDATIADQQSSLDKWIDYLVSDDALYPDGFKYFTLRSVLNMGEYDKEKRAYPQRSKGTTKPFPDLNREALAYVLDALDKKYRKQNIDLSSLNETDRSQFEKLLASENFPKLYAWAIEKVTPASPEELVATKGQWVKYQQGSDHMPLVQSLQGHGTGWCTAGESTASAQLQGGDFYVYYSLDKNGKPIVPRAAIRMEGDNKIAEVRGIAADQNLDAGVTPVVEQKLQEFPDGPSYHKKVADMEYLTAIDHKVQGGMELTGEDLSFLYEIDSTIEGFGYSKDPRIQEIRDIRDPDKDMLIIFDCDSSQIAHTARDIKPDTKAYVGKPEPGVFEVLKKYGIEQIFTKFPEWKIRMPNVEIGSKSEWQLEQELEQAKINVTDWAKDMMRKPEFSTLPTPQTLEVVRLRVDDLGFDRGATIDQIYQKAQELGLELCPAEVGPHLRLAYKNQPLDEWLYVGMKQISNSNGDPDVFLLVHNDFGLWLYDFWADPGNRWRPYDEFVFQLRKSAQRADDDTQRLSTLRNLFSSWKR